MLPLRCPTHGWCLGKRIAAYDKTTGLNSIYYVYPDVIEQAGALDMQLSEMMATGTPTLPSLFCVPFLIKEVRCPRLPLQG